jgi:methionyl-tRNA formyltransferase
MKRIVFLGKSKQSSIDAWDWLYRTQGPRFEATLVVDHREVRPCDLLVSFLYPRRVPDEVRARAHLALNFHPAPLPRYRGLWGCSRAILDGAGEFGVTAHEMVREFDAGCIVAERPVLICRNDTAESLDRRAQEVLLALFKDTVMRHVEGHALPLVPQPVVAAPPTRAELQAKKELFADDDAETVERKARAFWYPPYSGARVRLGGEWFTVAPHAVAEARSAGKAGA